MIGWLRGHILDKSQPGKLVLDVNGVGYDIETSLQTFFQVESEKGPLGLHIHTLVREDALILFGFLDKQERTLFRMLIKVNGVGPKMAIAILSSINPFEFIQCIKQSNALLLTKLPGIGKKTAERLIIEMKDSIGQCTGFESNMSFQNIMPPTIEEEAICALEALGYKKNEAAAVVKKVEGASTCEQIIRQALQHLSIR